MEEFSAVNTEDTSVESLPKAPVTVADICFRNNSKTYYFDPDGLSLREGDHVIVDTSRGIEYGICTAGNHEAAASEIVSPLRKILRRATAQDEKVNADNAEKEKKAFAICQQKVAERGLEMQLVSAECAFDGSKILFFFTADGRVDFRELVKDLASVFRTRIELRQIGVRDKAKMVGGLGMCGRPFCCREFLEDFQPVSIKMAKTQSLSLNPTKISGVCGRLMCCLQYEQDAYEDLLKNAPKAESLVDTPDGRGTITEVQLLRQCVKVRMEDHPENIGCYKNCDICVLRSGKAKKGDAPIPDDLAPISSAKAAEPACEEVMPEIIFQGEKLTDTDASEEAPSGNAPKTHRRRRPRGHGKPAEATKQDQPATKPQQNSNKEKGEAPANNNHHRRYRPRRGGSRPPKSE